MPSQFLSPATDAPLDHQIFAGSSASAPSQPSSTSFISTGDIAKGKVVIEGISRGALVAGLVAAADPSIAGIVLVSGLFDLPQFIAQAKTPAALMITQSIQRETGGRDQDLAARSILRSASKIKASVLILNGALDDRTSPHQARLLAEQITSRGGKARAIIYPRYGHHIPVQERDTVIEPFIPKTAVGSRNWHSNVLFAKIRDGGSIPLRIFRK